MIVSNPMKYQNCQPSGYCKEFINNTIFSEHFRYSIHMILRYLQEENWGGICIYGSHGSGKSHLITFVSLILGNKDNVRYVNCTDEADNLLKCELNSLAGQYHILRVEPDARMRIKDILPQTKELSCSKEVIVILDDFDKYLETEKTIAKENLISLQSLCTIGGVHVIYTSVSKQLFDNDRNEIDLMFSKIVGHSLNVYLFSSSQ